MYGNPSSNRTLIRSDKRQTEPAMIMLKANLSLLNRKLLKGFNLCKGRTEGSLILTEDKIKSLPIKRLTANEISIKTRAAVIMRTPAPCMPVRTPIINEPYIPQAAAIREHKNGMKISEKTSALPNSTY